MSSNRVTIDKDVVVVEPRGIDKLWSFTRRLRIPLAQVKRAFFDPGLIDNGKGWRGPGLRIAHKVAGTFHKDGKKQFWNVSGYDQAILIELRPGARFNRVILTVSDPHAVVDAINTARANRPLPGKGESP